jgi:putative transcriptional regulator
MQNRVRALRTERLWSQADLAERLSVSRQTVIAIESRKSEPGLSLAFRIARLFGRSIEAVFEPDDDFAQGDGAR